MPSTYTLTVVAEPGVGALDDPDETGAGRMRAGRTLRVAFLLISKGDVGVTSVDLSFGTSIGNTIEARLSSSLLVISLRGDAKSSRAAGTAS